VISLTQSSLPYHKQHSQQTDIHETIGVRTHNPNIRAASDVPLRTCGHHDWPFSAGMANNYHENTAYIYIAYQKTVATVCSAIYIYSIPENSSNGLQRYIFSRPMVQSYQSDYKKYCLLECDAV
jgi:hypothetical protein